MNIWGITDIGLVRQENQDSYRTAVVENGLVAVVCDGMGGARGGRVASSLAADTFVDTVCSLFPEGEPELLLRQAVDAVNERVYAEALQNPELRGMGTTLVAALVTEEKIWVANVGDSRCYRVEEGAITRLTRDHSYVEDLVCRGEITAEQARTHPKKNLITRAVGVDHTVKTDVYTLENKGGYLLLCSDGLSNPVTDEEIRGEVVAEDKDGCCRRLLTRALDRGAPDNVTVVLVQL